MACKRALKDPWGWIDYILISFVHLPLAPETSQMAGNQIRLTAAYEHLSYEQSVLMNTCTYERLDSSNL
jgi:hypothetical protein